jgi:hypothetical protein
MKALLPVKLFVATVYVLCLGEVFVRLFAPVAIIPRYITRTSYGVRGNIPNARYQHFTPDVSVEYRINSAGFRSDVEYPLKKPEGGCRVLMFGDSFMMGYEANLEDTIPYRLEQSLRASGKPCDVINMAVSGFGTAEMLVALENNGLAYSPDAIVFEWHSTDLDDNVRSGLYDISDGKLRRVHETYLPAVSIQDTLQQFAIYRFLSQYSQLYSAARETLTVRVKAALVHFREANTAAGSDEEGAANDSSSQGGDQSYEGRLAALLLTEAAKVARSHDARFYVLDIPAEQKDGHVQSTFDLVDQPVVAPLHVVHLDTELNRIFDGGVQIFYHRGHGHFTPTGYHAAASALFDAMKADADVPVSHDETSTSTPVMTSTSPGSTSPAASSAGGSLAISPTRLVESAPTQPDRRRP